MLHPVPEGKMNSKNIFYYAEFNIAPGVVISEFVIQALQWLRADKASPPPP